MKRQNETKYCNYILDTLKKKHIATAGEIHTLYPEMNTSTVYRILKRLQDRGVVKEVLLSSTKAHFELVSDNHLAHFVCSVCGSIECVNVDITHKTIASMLPKYHVTQIALEITGRCPRCLS